MEERAGTDPSSTRAEQTAREIGRTADAIRDMARETSDLVVETSRELADNASGIAGELIDKMREAAQLVLEDQKGRAGDAVARLAEFMHRTARTFEGESPPVAQLAAHAAEHAELWAAQLRQRSWNELLADTEEFAQRRPMLYLAGSVTAGFVLARLLGSTRARPGAGPSSADLSSSEPPGVSAPAGDMSSDRTASSMGEVGTSSAEAKPESAVGRHEVAR